RRSDRAPGGRPVRSPRARADPGRGRRDRGRGAQAPADIQRPARGQRHAGPSSLPAQPAARGAGAHRKEGMRSQYGAAPPPGFARHLPMNGEELRSWELDRNPDLIDLVSAARDAGHEVMLIERPMPDAVSVAAIGRAFDIVAAPGGVSLEDAGGRQIDVEKEANRIVAAARLWRRVATSEGALGVGGFGWRPGRGLGGADGTAFAGASPELLIRRSGNHAFSQPMAGSVARGATDAEDDRLGRQLSLSAKDRSEHRLVSKFVMDALRPLSSAVSAREPEVARFTNIQHLATSVEAKLSAPAADALTLAAALHPTPAVGGWPRVAADLLIDELESM